MRQSIHNTRQVVPFHRVLALSLAATLAVPNSAFALRQSQPENERQRSGLEEALRKDSPQLTQMGPSTTPTTPTPLTTLPMAAAPQPAQQAGMEDAKKVIEQAFGNVPADVRRHLMQLFESRIHYFKDKERLNAFKRRVRKFEDRILSVVNDRKLYATKDSFYKDVLFLMLVRGTIKDLVWENAQDGRTEIEVSGGRPEAFFNLFEPKQAREVLQEVLGSKIFKNADALSDELEWLTGHTLEAFQRNSSLFDIFADQVVAALRTALLKRQNQLPKDDPRRPRIDQILAKLRSDMYGDRKFLLTDRSVYFLKGGNRAGDCTACGSLRGWTAGVWNATFENFELEMYHQGEFFARFVGIVGKSRDDLAVWVHAVEFTPLARSPEGMAAKSRFAEAALQKELLSDALRFLDAFAKRGGAKRVYLTGISNSYGFVNILTDLVNSFSEQHGIGFKPRPFRLLNGLHSAHGIREWVEGKPLEESLPIVLQGWIGPTRFARSTGLVEQESQQTVSIAGQEIDRYELDRGSVLFMALIRDELDFLPRDWIGYRDIRAALWNAMKTEANFEHPNPYDTLLSQWPSNEKELDEYFSTLIENLGNLQGIRGSGMMAVLERLHSRVTLRFERAMEMSGNYTAEGIRLMTEHPAEVVDYYKSRFPTDSKGTALSLTSDVRVLSLENVFPSDTPYLSQGKVAGQDTAAGLEEDEETGAPGDRDRLAAYRRIGAQGISQMAPDEIRSMIRWLREAAVSPNVVEVALPAQTLRLEVKEALRAKIMEEARITGTWTPPKDSAPIVFSFEHANTLPWAPLVAQAGAPVGVMVETSTQAEDLKKLFEDFQIPDWRYVIVPMDVAIDRKRAVERVRAHFERIGLPSIKLVPLPANVPHERIEEILKEYGLQFDTAPIPRLMVVERYLSALA
jgi:hypothetical protein